MKELATELNRLRGENLLRTRTLLTSAQQIEPVINGRKILSFCSNDYLGLANHPRLINAYVHAAKRFGVGSGASHLITGHHASHHALEEELSEFLGCERTLLFSTGYMANLGLIGALTDRETCLFEDRLNHASLIDAAVLSRARLKRYAHRDMEALAQSLKAAGEADKFIASDGVFSMDGTVAQVDALQDLAQAHDARLVLDDAHGIGVLGAQGKGCTEGRRAADTVLVGTLGKAFGVFGAFVGARTEVIEWCVQRARSYIYTTALPASVAEAARTALHLIIEEAWRRAALRVHVAYFRECATQTGIPLTDSETPIQPVVLGEATAALKVSRELLDEGLLVQAIRPPTVPKDQARLRITFCATHSRTHIDRLVECLARSCADSAARPQPAVGD